MLISGIYLIKPEWNISHLPQHLFFSLKLALTPIWLSFFVDWLKRIGKFLLLLIGELGSVCGYGFLRSLEWIFSTIVSRTCLLVREYRPSLSTLNSLTGMDVDVCPRKKALRRA